MLRFASLTTIYALIKWRVAPKGTFLDSRLRGNDGGLVSRHMRSP
ncbi:hypothetical protein AGMMS50256_05300 [Betaproteobacteria bacterium]|nr:hypothetical protein AGMMS50256_05300 [Betaproteobacteria bacterium]